MRQRLFRHWAAALLATVLLAGCSSNPNRIEPNPLPDFTAEYKVSRVWSRGVGDGIGKEWLQLTPAVTHRGVYAADLNGLVLAVTPENGKRLWRVKTGDRISGGLRAASGLVVYGTREGDVVALSEDDGSEVWRVNLRAEVLAPAAIEGTMMVLHSIDGRVFGLDARSGEVRWTYDSPAPILTLRGASEPLIVRDRAYVALANARVVALDLQSGAPVWERRVAEPRGRSELERLVDITNNLIVQGGGVFVSTFQGTVGVLDQESGRPYWNRDMSSYVPMASHQTVLYVADSTGHLWALSQRSGETLWKQDLLYGRGLTGVAVADGRLVVGDAEGYLHWLDAESGQFVARTRHHGDGFAAPPVARDGVVYAFGREGKLSAYVLKPR